MFLVLLVLAGCGRRSHTWVSVSSDPAYGVATLGGRLVDGYDSGGCMAAPCPTTAVRAWVTREEPSAVTADLAAKLRNLGYVPMKPTAVNGEWRARLSRTTQWRRGELTVRLAFEPTPYGRGKHQPPVGVAEGPRVALVEIDNESAVSEGAVPRRPQP